MSVVNQSNVNLTNFRVKPFEINEVLSIEKKFNFCDRDYYNMIMRDSGKQISIELQTIMYEYFKNCCVNVLANIASVEVLKEPIGGEDLNRANIETQHFLGLKTRSGVPYSITFNLYHTKCSMLVQTFDANKHIWMEDFQP